MTLSELQAALANRTAQLAVVGLGYVGLPAAAMFAAAGFSVLGVELRAERVETINAGRSPIEGDEPGLVELIARVVGAGRLRATTNPVELRNADVILVVVETPVDEHDHRPRYEALRGACRTIGQVMKPGVLVIVESTVAPGTIDQMVCPLLEESSGRTVNEGFYVGTCPERVMPGRLLHNMQTLSRVCGGGSPETAEAMVTLYRHIVKADLDMADPVTAELTKTAENAFRDVQIAFANELAMICETVGADVWRVRELINKSPGRNVLFPGAGVGGHCIPKDPWLLASAASPELPLRLIPAAREVNESMPLHMLRLLEDALAEAGRSLSGARVAVLGYAYLEDSGDTRNSPSERLVDHLRGANATALVHDPWVPPYRGDVMSILREADAAVLMVKHREYREMSPGDFKTALRGPVLIDGRGIFDQEAARQAGLIFRGIGRAPSAASSKTLPPADGFKP